MAEESQQQSRYPLCFCPLGFAVFWFYMQRIRYTELGEAAKELQPPFPFTLNPVSALSIYSRENLPLTSFNVCVCHLLQ